MTSNEMTGGEVTCNPLLSKFKCKQKAKFFLVSEAR